MKTSPVQFFILRLALAGLFLSLGINKINEGWLTNTEHLAHSLNDYHQHAAGVQLRYLDYIAIPYASLWSRVIALGEAALGASLLLGLLVRLSTLMGIVMVFALHAATGSLFTLSFFGSAWAAFLVAGLLVLFLSRAGRWAGVDALLATSNSKGLLW